LGHFILARKFGVRIEVFSLGFGKKLFSVKHKNTEYRISSIPLGGYVKMAGEMPYEAGAKGAKDEFISKTGFQRALILAAGPLLNYVLGFLLFSLVFMTGSPQITSKIGVVMDGYPAKQAGLKEGDRITGLNGKPVAYWEQILDVVHNTTEGPVALVVKRQDREFSLTLVPSVKEMRNIFGQKMKIGLLGIMPSDEIKYVKYNPLEAVYLAGVKTWNFTWMTYLSLWRMATGAMSFRESVAGPVGIFMITQKAQAAGMPYLLSIMAILSISLAIFNLLPIPVLDGGHLFFLVIEKIRGRILSPKVYELITQFGMAFLITLMLFVLYNDAAKAGWVDNLLKLIRR